jgi:hypothetical protein
MVSQLDKLKKGQRFNFIGRDIVYEVVGFAFYDGYKISLYPKYGYELHIQYINPNSNNYNSDGKRTHYISNKLYKQVLLRN